MIDLNTRIEPSEPINESREPLNGTFTFKVIKITPWKAEPAKTIQVAERDETNRVVKDASGKVVRHTMKDVVLYSTVVTLEVQDDGEFKGRRVFHRFDTHPDFAFIIGQFTYACDVGSPTLAEIPTVCLNQIIEASVEPQTYDKKVVDKETGIEQLVPTTISKITKFTRSLGI